MPSLSPACVFAFLAAPFVIACSSQSTATTADADLKAKPALNVELKVTVASDLGRDALDLHDDDAEARDIFFFDTAELELFDLGVILRARNIHDDADDSTVKIRPLASGEVAKSWFGRDGFKCEIDRTYKGSVESCSMTVEQGEDEIEDVARDERPIKKLYSSEQEAFLAAYAEAPPWSDLWVLGPVEALVWKLEPKELDTTLTVEEWAFPDGTQLLELSARAPIDEADVLEEDFAVLLDELGLEADTEGDAKTRAALDYFAPSAAD